MQISWKHVPEKVVTTGPWQVSAVFEPFHGESPGGDRFGAALSAEDSLAFYVADANGHGALAAGFWEEFGEDFDRIWLEFVREANHVSLARFGRDLNDTLTQGAERSSKLSTLPHLCLAAGWLHPDGELVFANFGLGIHVLPVTEDGLWAKPPAEMFGLKLGWLDSVEWGRYSRSLTIRRLTGVRQLAVITDAFVPDDHHDPDEAIHQARELGAAISKLPLKERGAVLTEGLLGTDDATALLIEPLS